MKNLVIVMAGDDSLHEHYASERDFELWVCHWGRDAGTAARFRQTCDRFFPMQGQKWALVRELGRIAREQRLPAFSSYDYVFLPDDDLEFPGGATDIARAFALARDIGADIFQPAVANENFSPGWEHTHRLYDAVCHATSVVEIMMPCYSGEIFERCVLPLLHIHGYITVGWGLEPLIARFAEVIQHRPARSFVLDEIAAIHSRAVGAGTSSYSVGKDEAFLIPYSRGMHGKDLSRFRNRTDAMAFVFPAADELVDSRSVEKHLTRVRGARRIHDARTSRGPGSFILKQFQKFAARVIRD
ncbi:hypothetical protein DFR52_10814 [Hoeflea marina]|uniref:Glycosyl transferase family 2 n=1 Tax=Hoeflea marina TaxID=274592 RepID=A0A317PEY0_9HYPH|nr:hypothetical protein [Hoeflea marina]PWV95750.1 hypothetical protein DFR52_10814 [Hoeflea marina]